MRLFRRRWLVDYYLSLRCLIRVWSLNCFRPLALDFPFLRFCFMYIESFSVWTRGPIPQDIKVIEYSTSIHRNISANFSTLCLSVSVRKIVSAGCKLMSAALVAHLRRSRWYFDLDERKWDDGDVQKKLLSYHEGRMDRTRNYSYDLLTLLRPY